MMIPSPRFLLLVLFLVHGSDSQGTSEERLAAEFESDLNLQTNPLFSELELDVATEVGITLTDEDVTEGFPQIPNFVENIQKLQGTVISILAENSTTTESISTQPEVELKLETGIPSSEPETTTLSAGVTTTVLEPSSVAVTTETSKATTVASIVTPPKSTTTASKRKAWEPKAAPKVLLIESKSPVDVDEDDEEDEADGNGRPPQFRNNALNSFLAKKKRARKESTTEYDPLAAFFKRYTVKKTTVTTEKPEELEVPEVTETSSIKPTEEAATGRAIPGVKRFGFPGKRPLLKQQRLGGVTESTSSFSVIDQPHQEVRPTATKRGLIKPPLFLKKFGKPANSPTIDDSSKEEAPQLPSRRNLFRPRSPLKIAMQHDTA